MVVNYPAASKGSATSFFTITPQVVFWLKGSAIPNVLPQCLIAQGIAVAALQLQQRTPYINGSIQFGMIGFLVAFLLIFKTQTAYKQFWTAVAQVDGILNINRILARGACTLSDWKATPEAPGYIRRFIRYQALYFFVLIEYFLREGDPNTREVETDEVLDILRLDIECFCSEVEFNCLYPKTKKGTPGSKVGRVMNMKDEDGKPYPEQRVANPVVILYWMQCILREGVNDNDVKKSFVKPPAVFSIMVNGISGLERHFWTMEKIDKLQFPLPYAQVVKILVVIYVFAFPFTIVKACGFYTLPITLLVSIGFFGLDEVAEILESPFSSDPNAINLRQYAPQLVRDLDMMYHEHESMKQIALDKATFDDRRLFVRWEEYRTQKGEGVGAALWRKTKTLTRAMTGFHSNTVEPLEKSPIESPVLESGAAPAYDSPTQPPLRAALPHRVEPEVGHANGPAARLPADRQDDDLGDEEEGLGGAAGGSLGGAGGGGGGGGEEDDDDDAV